MKAYLVIGPRQAVTVVKFSSVAALDTLKEMRLATERLQINPDECRVKHVNIVELEDVTDQIRSGA